MVARLGKRRLVAAAFVGLLLPQWPGALSAPALGAIVALIVQDGPGDGDVERLRAMLALAGPDGREARETAIERLLVLPTAEAHRVLQQRLGVATDPDGVRAAILASLQRHWSLPAAAQHGGAAGELRERIVADYVRALAPLWRPLHTRAGAAEPLLAAATTALQRMPVRELETAARLLLPAVPLPEQLDVLRCLADMQQVLLAPVLADHLDAADPELRRAAQENLQLLTYADPPLRTREQFQAWFAANGELRYVDLAQRAARAGVEPGDRLRQALAQMRVDWARDVVKAHVTRTAGIDWAAVQARVVGDDVAVLDACLELLQQALPALPDEPTPTRLAFCRALLQRHAAEPAESAMRRARLLEVAAWLGRPEDTELAADIVNRLLEQLDGTDPQFLASSMRGLRRYPSVETRGRLAALGLRLLAQQPVPGDRVAAVLATLGSRASPRWTAPKTNDSDKADWVALVTACCRSEEALGLREPALALAQLLTERDRRVPEIFDVLLAIVRDEGQPVRYRATCLLHLQGWRNDPDVVAAWVRAQQELLVDPEAELRRLAADSLAGLVESVESGRSDWFITTIAAVRQRLPVEPEPAVVRALVACLERLGREPGMPERAIGALRWVLTEIKYPVAPDHEFRMDPLLQALATIAADPRADQGQWLSACASLSLHDRRQSLRLVLQNHAAIELAKDVAHPESEVAGRARQAMQYVINAGAMKPPQLAWTATPELQREALDVRRAFVALDSVDEKDRYEKMDHRLLRLEVDLVANKPQDVVQRATAWLATNGNGGTARPQPTDAKRDRMRALAAAAQLALGRPELARKLLEERAGDTADATVLELEAKVARGLAATDLAGSVEMLGRVVQRTPTEDPQFRPRLLEWLNARLRLDPSDRAAVLREAERHRKLFDQADCPSDVREQWKLLTAN
jgi:hypothetical protein